MCLMYWSNPCKVMLGGPLRRARRVKAAAGGEGTPKLYIFDAHWIAFGAFLVPLMPKWAPFWAPLGFEGVPNENNSIQNLYEVWKTYDQEYFQEKHQFFKDFRYRKKSQYFFREGVFALYLFHFKRLRRVTNFLWKMGIHWGDSWDWEWVLEDLAFFVLSNFSIDPKIDNNSHII